MNITESINTVRNELGFPLREDLAWELITARRKSRGWGDGIDWDGLWEAVFLDAFRWARRECRRQPHPSYRRKVLRIAQNLEHGLGDPCEEWPGDVLEAELERLQY